MRRTLLSASLIQIILLHSLSGLATAAQRGGDDLWDEVPPAMRAEFDGRLNLLIESMRSERYEAAYYLLAKSHTRDESRESFVRRLKGHYSSGDKITGFVPEVIGSDAGAGKEARRYMVLGCLEMREKGRRVSVSASVNVYPEEGKLYFSELGPLRTLDGKYLPCSDQPDSKVR